MISCEKKENMNIISLPGTLNEFSLTSLQTEIKKWLLFPVKLHILDFQQVVSVKKAPLRELTKFIQTLKSNDKFCASVSMPTKILREFIDLGLKSAFNPVKDVDEARKIAGLTSNKNKVNAQFLSYFVDAAKSTLSTQLGVDITVGKPRKKDDKEPNIITIAGVMNIVSSHFNGSISICFPEKTFLAIWESMFDEKLDVINEDIQDTAGELLNIIYGKAKTRLVDELGYDLKPVIPNVMYGKELRISYNTQVTTMILPMECSLGPLHMEFVLEN